MTPPAERVQFILGEDDQDGAHESHPLFSELEELVYDGNEQEWRETARYDINLHFTLRRRKLNDHFNLLLLSFIVLSFCSFHLNLTPFFYHYSCSWRWIKFEEDVEEGGDRWSKPHVATISLHSLFELRSCILNGTVLLDMEATSLDQIAGE